MSNQPVKRRTDNAYEGVERARAFLETRCAELEAAVQEKDDEIRRLEALADDACAKQAETIARLRSASERAVVWIDKAMDIGEPDKQHIHMGHAKRELTYAALEV